MLKTVCILIATLSVSFAVDYELVIIPGSGYELSPNDALFFGMDYNAVEHLLLIADHIIGYDYGAWAWDPTTGYGNAMYYLDDDNQNPFGVVWSNNTTYSFYVNDTVNPNMFVSNDGDTWNAIPGVMGNDARGMTIANDGYLWANYSTGQLCRFTDSPGDATFFGIPQVQGAKSGLTFLEYQGSEYLLVATYTSGSEGLFLFQYTGSTPIFLGSIPFPDTDCMTVHGLAYAADRNTIFICYKRASDGYWCFRETYMQVANSLDQVTWGWIKSLQ